MENPQSSQHAPINDKDNIVSNAHQDDTELSTQTNKGSSLIGQQDSTQRKDDAVPSSDNLNSTPPSEQYSNIAHPDASNNIIPAEENTEAPSESLKEKSAIKDNHSPSPSGPPLSEPQRQPDNDLLKQEKANQATSNSAIQSGQPSEDSDLHHSESRGLIDDSNQSKDPDNPKTQEDEGHGDFTEPTPRISKLPELPSLQLSTGGFGESLSTDWDEGGSELQGIFGSQKGFSIGTSKLPELPNLQLSAGGFGDPLSADWDEAGSELQGIFGSQKAFSIQTSPTKAQRVPISELGTVESDAASDGEDDELEGDELEKAVIKGYMELAGLAQRTGELETAVTHYSEAMALLDKAFQRENLYETQSSNPPDAMDPLQVERKKTLQATHSFIVSSTSQAAASILLPLSRTLCNIQTNLKGHRHRDTLTPIRSLVTLLYFNGLYNEANFLGGESLRIAREEFGEKNTETLYLKHTMGHVARELGFLPQARELLEEVIAVRESEGSINEELLEAILDLATVFEELELLDEMVDFQEKKSSFLRSKLSIIHPLTLRCEAALALTQAKIEGREAQAKSLALDVVQRSQGLFGERHRRTLDAFANKAMVLVELGELDEAEAVFSDVLDQHIQILGDSDLSTLQVKENYAVLLQNTGSFDRALGIQDTLVSQYVAVLGDRHPHTIKSFMDRASSLGALGRFGEARSLLENDIVPAYEGTYGKEGSKTIKALQALSATLVQLGELVTAREVQEKVVAALKKRHGERDPATITASLTLSTIVWSAGGETEGLAMEIAAMNLQKEVLGAKDPVVLQTMHNHAVTLQSIGRYGPSLRTIDEVVKSRQEVLGNGDKDTVASLWTMVCAYEGLGKIGEALETMKRMIKYAEIGRGEAADGSRNISEDRQVSDEELEEYRDSLREMNGEVQLFEKKFGAIL